MPGPDRPNTISSSEFSLKLQPSTRHSLATTISRKSCVPLAVPCVSCKYILASPVPPNLAPEPRLTCALTTAPTLPHIHTSLPQQPHAPPAPLKTCTLAPVLTAPGTLLCPITTAAFPAPVRASCKMPFAPSSFSSPRPQRPCTASLLPSKCRLWAPNLP